MATRNEKRVNLSIGRGEKRTVKEVVVSLRVGKTTNAATGSNLKAPQPQGGPRKRSWSS